MSRNQSSEIIIIGGGVIGLATARALSSRGLGQVTVIERGEFGAEASWAAGGMLAPQAEADCADEFFELAVASRELYPELIAELCEETGIEIGLERSGTLYLAFTDQDEQDIAHRYRWQSEAGLPVHRLTGTEARALEPELSPLFRGALHFPQDIQVENRQLVQALRRSNEMRGVRLLSDTEVIAINIYGPRVTGVKTTAGELNAGAVIVAGGAWSSLIPFSDGRSAPIVIEPVRGQMLCFSGARFARHVIYSPRGYVVPRADGRILAGSTSESIGFDKNVTAGGLHAITGQAIEIAPTLASLPLTDHWSGLRPRSVDGLPVVGELERLGRLFYATGHYRNGILLAPITAKLLAEEIATGVRPKLMRPFSPDRFVEQNSVKRLAYC